MLNKVILMGRLTRDPEFRQTPSGVPVCRFSVAVNRSFVNKQTGERETDFIDCVAWRSSAEFISRYFSKGSMIIVEGSLRNDNYTDNNGVKHYRMNVQVDNVTFGESKNASQGGGSYGGQQGGGFAQQGGYPQQGGYAQPQRQFADPQQSRPAAPMQDAAQIGDIGEFEEILSDGEVPF